MSFTSIEFYLLIIILFVIYYLPFQIVRRAQILLLVAASFLFYAWHVPALLILLIASSALNCVASYLVSTSNQKKFWAILGVVVNLGVLATFKYSGLLISTFIGETPADSLLNGLATLPLPIGISFYTFQGISLVVDSFRDSEKGKKLSIGFWQHSYNTFLFISFFPQLVAGPIVKAHDFIPQIKTKYFQDIDWNYVCSFLVIGYFLKMFVADNLASQLTMMGYFQNASTLTLLSMLLGYSCQIFADFAGYSLIALGLASLFGYQLALNFNLPYISGSFSEFWTRWHISLSSFLKEYLYIPLGGNRTGRFRTYLNLMIVMGLGGLWHGAAWKYAVWGLWHGGMLAIERFFKHKLNIRPFYLEKLRYLRILLVFSLVTLAWLLFRMPTLQDVINYLVCMKTNLHNPNDRLVGYVALYVTPIILMHLNALLPFSQKIREMTNGRLKQQISSFGYALLLFLVVTGSGYAHDFIYFQF